MPQFKLTSEIIKRSVAQTWDKAKLEWSLLEVYEAEEPFTVGQDIRGRKKGPQRHIKISKHSRCGMHSTARGSMNGNAIFI